MWSTLRGRNKRPSETGSKNQVPMSEGNAATKKPPIPTRGAVKELPQKGSQGSPTGSDGTIKAHPTAGGNQSSAEVGQDSANNVKVLIRMRPLNSREKDLTGDASNLQQVGSSGLHLAVEDRDYDFKFDEVLGLDGTQEELFKLAGQPMVSNVMQGYNACCFAYGQTGSGKTHTMQGELGSDASGGPNELRGLAPRVFQQVFQAIENKEGDAAGAQLQYTCRCSFLQIYNEQISDLLHPAEKPLALRYDSESGVYVENLTEHVVVNMEDAMALMKQGASNRCVGETKMNRASSRSHSVFSMKVECCTTMENGISKLRYGTLHIVDLAGSERVKISGATGAALTEASEINVSLTTLGRVISKVVESQASKQVGRHIPYRDSKLTFLLQDSLGGNAKTMLVANVSPSTACAHETLSTLQFAERAKCIRNHAKVNTDTQGDQRALQAEVERLQAELSSLQDGVTGPLRAERDALKERLDEVSTCLRDATTRLENVSDERDQLQFQLTRLDEKLIKKETDLSQLEDEIKSLKDKAEADITAARTAAAEELANVGKAHEKSLAAAAAAKEAIASQLQTERDAAIKGLTEDKDTEVYRVTAETEERIQRLEEVAASAVAELESVCEGIRKERDVAVKERDEVEKRLTGELEQGLHAAAEAAETAAEEARVAAKEAQAAHATELQAARESLLEEKKAALEEADDRVREEERALRETALAEAEAKHAADVEGLQTASTGKLTDVQKELEATKQAQDQEKTAAQEAADAAASEVEALCKQIADAEEAAIQEKETAASAVEAMRSLQEKTAADAVSVQQKLESEFIAQCDKVQELQKSLEEAQQQLEARGGDVSVAEKAIADREAALEDARKQVAVIEKQIAEQKAESHASLQSTRSELTTALQAHTAAEARAVQAEALVSTKSGSLTETRSEITLLKVHISDLEDKLSAAQQALSTATEERHTTERDLHSTHTRDLDTAKAEAASTARVEAEAVRLREIAAVSDRAAASEKALREEHTREVDRVCSDSKEVSETLEKEVAALREQAATAAAALAAVNAELLTAQREAMDASDAAAADTERLQDEMGELVDAKDEEIARLRASLERAEAQEQSEVASLQDQLMVQERDAAVLRAQMRDALAAAAETEATSAADASAARAEWAGEAAQLAADRDIQLSHIEEAAAAHKKDLEDLTAQYEGQLAAAKAAASNAADSSETEKAAAIAARTAAAAAAEREALLKQSLHDVEERSAATSSQLGATQQRVQELEEKLAALSDDLTAQRSAVESAQRSAGDAAQERIDELQAQVEETQIERDQMQTDVHSLQQQLHDQDRRYRESAVESVTKIQALECHIAELEDALGRSEALRADIQADLDNKDSQFEEANRSNQIFAHLLDNIQEQILAGSRPGSAASAQGGSNNAEAMIGAVRQSLDAAGLGKAMPQRLRTPQRPGKLSSAALRPSSVTSESPSHNEYSRRERGLGKPCFTMDMGPGITPNYSSGSLQAYGGKEGGSGPLGYQHGVSGPNSVTEENASPNASLKGFNRPWDNTA